MGYKVLQPEDDSATSGSSGTGYKIITPESDPSVSLTKDVFSSAKAGFEKGWNYTAPIRQIPGDIAHAAGSAMLGLFNIPRRLAGEQPLTRENFMPQEGVQKLLEDVQAPIKGNTIAVGGARDALNHLIARGAHEMITPENVPLIIAGGGLPAAGQKALGIMFGSQGLAQAPLDIRQGDVEGALLHGGAGAVGVGLPALFPERVPGSGIGSEDIQSRLTSGDIDQIRGRIPPERQLPGPRGQFVANLRGEVGQVGENVPDVQVGQATDAMQDLLARDRMKRALQGGGGKPVPGAEPRSVAVAATDLRPAVKVGDKVLVGEPGDTHADVLSRNGIDPESIPHSDPRRGFVSVKNPTQLIDRQTAQQLSGINGTAEAGGLDSMDLPDAAQHKLMRMMEEQDKTKGPENAVSELRADELSKTSPPGDIQTVGEEIRPGAEAEGFAQGGQGQEETLATLQSQKVQLEARLDEINEHQRKFTKNTPFEGQTPFNAIKQTQDLLTDVNTKISNLEGPSQLKFYGGIPIPSVEDLINTGKVGKEVWDRTVDAVDRAAMTMRSKMEFYDILAHKLQQSDDPRAKARLPEIEKLRDDLMRTEDKKIKFATGVPIPSFKDITDTAKFVKDSWNQFSAGRFTKERMAQLLDAAYNRAKTPQQLTELKKEWVEKLGEMKMSDGKPLVAKRAKGGELQEGFENRDFLGVRIAVNKDVANMFDSLTAESGVRRNPVGRALLASEKTVKHGLLMFDTYHAFRIARKTAFLTGDIPRYINKSLVEYSPQEMMDAFDKGDVTKDDVEYYRKNYRDGQLLLRGGLNVKQWAENLGLTEKGILKPINVKGIDVNPLSQVRKFNSWVFDKLSRSAMMQVGLYELNRARKAHPDWSEEQLVSHVVRQSNIYLGNMGRQGILKSQTMRDMAQIAFLAPQWVEALAQSEARAGKQLAQVPLDIVTGKGFNVGTQAKGIGTGVVAYLVANQIINMATTGHPTWENKEKGRKFDAYIPALDKKSQGFWLSPFSDVAEMTHDYERYMNKGAGFGEATAKIIQNKMSPLARAEETYRTGRDYAGRRLDEHERVVESLKALLPVPLPLAGLKGDQSGSEQRQLFASAGLKLEPKGRYEDMQGLTFEERLKKVQEYKQGQGKLDPASKVRATEEAVFRQQERAKEVTKQLSRADRNWLESRDLVMPGFASNIRVGKVDVPLTEDETQELTRNVTEGAKQTIMKLRESETFNRQPRSAQQEVFNGYMRALISVERDKIRRNMGQGDAQKLGATGGHYRILQPE